MGPSKQKNQQKGSAGASGRGNKNKKESSSYLADDENFQGFSNQLAKLGLELRDITGDGNCCFRALSDQMEGNEGQHLDYRKRVCQYMRQNREEFEPFVAALIDDEQQDQNENNQKSRRFTSSKKIDAFEKYIKNLEQAGTYADNGCLVAFARLYRVNINIHQLNMPIWTIDGVTNYNGKQPVRQLHLSYHNGEHYSSIRPLGDRTNTPTNIYFNDNNNNPITINDKSSASSGSSSSKTSKKNTTKSNGKEASSDYCASSISSNVNSYYNDNDYDYNEDNYDDVNIKVEQIIDATNCLDVNLIKEKLYEHNNDVEMTIFSLMSLINLNNEDGRARSNGNLTDDDDSSDDDSNVNNINCVKLKSSSSKQKKNDKKQEKK